MLSKESMLEGVVWDTAVGGWGSGRLGRGPAGVGGGGGGGGAQSAQSTLSRYARRIMCERSPPYTARIYAAGFDSSKNIFLGVRNAKRCGNCLLSVAVVPFRERLSRGETDVPVAHLKCLGLLHLKGNKLCCGCLFRVA